MVGKGDSKNSRIFTQCYLKCCKLQNLTPINNVVPSGNGKVLDFCVDRIKYVDWAPILNALSCDLSLHSVSIRCRQQVKTVLEHIDCERLAKTVNKRAVILTNFMLSNLMEAVSQLLANTTLLTSLQLEGLPLKIPYLNPLSEELLRNSSLQHLYLPRCLIGDAGCLAICKAVRCMPNMLTLDLSGCELTPLGAGYIADLIKYQKIHRYSENWVHTLRYRLPELDTMAGLRRITLCGNQQLGDAGVKKLLDVLADDLWIKALDVQNCGLTEDCASAALQMLVSNTTLVVLDLRHNPLLSSESLSKIRSALRENERGISGQYSWIGVCSSSSESKKSVAPKNGTTRERVPSNVRTAPNKYNVKANNIVKKEKDYASALEDQLQDETTHRRQLEELNERLVQQMRSLKQQQMQLWQNSPSSSNYRHYTLQLQDETTHRRQLEELNERLVQQMRSLKQQQMQLWQNSPSSSNYRHYTLQLQDETTHRRQLEELNERLVQQMRSLKQQQMQLWQNSPSSSNYRHYTLQLQDETTHRRQLEELNERLVQQMRSLKQQQMQLWQNSPSSSNYRHYTLQLQDETTHRRQLEELNERLVPQMRSLKQQQMQLWQNSPSSSSEQSFQASSRSGDLSTSSGSTSSVPIDQNTLSYIQQAFKDIYAYIKNNQCQGQCHLENSKEEEIADDQEPRETIESADVEQVQERDLRVKIVPKKAQSTHLKMRETPENKMKKMTKSAHLLGDMQHRAKKNEMKLEMIERQMGDSMSAHGDDQSISKDVIAAEKDIKRNMQESPCSSVSDSSDTLVYSPKSPRSESVYQAPCVETVYKSPRRESVYQPQRSVNLNPRDAMYSSSDEDS